MKYSIDRGVLISFVVGAVILVVLIAGFVLLDDGEADSPGGNSADLTEGEPQRNEAGYITYPDTYANRVVRTVIHQQSASEEGDSSFSLEQWTAFNEETQPQRVMQVVREGDGTVVVAIEGDRQEDTGRRYNQTEGDQCMEIAWSDASQAASSGLPSHADEETHNAQQLMEGGEVSALLAGQIEFEAEEAGDPDYSLVPSLEDAAKWSREQSQGGMQLQQTSFTDQDNGLLVATQLQRIDEEGDEAVSAELSRVALLSIYGLEAGDQAMDTAIEWDSFCA